MRTHKTIASAPPYDKALLEVRVGGPYGSPVEDADLERLFPGTVLTQARRERLRQWPCIIVSADGNIVGMATCQSVGGEVRAPDLAVALTGISADLRRDLCERDVLATMLDAIELVGLAGDCRRVVISPPTVSASFLVRRGYVRINEHCAGGWLEKAIQ